MHQLPTVLLFPWLIAPSTTSWSHRQTAHFDCRTLKTGVFVVVVVVAVVVVAVVVVVVVVVLLWLCFGGVFVVVWWCGGVLVFFWWCFCGGVLWWCFCGVLWWCFSGVFVVVEWCFGGGVFVVVFSNIAQSSTEVMDFVKDCHQTSPKVLPKWWLS